MTDAPDPDSIEPRRDAQRIDTKPGEYRSGSRPRVVTSDSLLAGAAELAILHNETIYFLRQTRLGKLILTK